MNVQTEWSPAISEKEYYNWFVSKSEFEYDEYDLIGGINMLRGDILFYIRSNPLENFNFFNGSRLDLRVLIEGDAFLTITQYNTDCHLFLLPIKMGSENFFKLLFNEQSGSNFTKNR